MATALATFGSGVPDRAEMSEANLQAILKREIASSIGGDYGTGLTSEHSQALITQREQALRAYYAEPIGNEVEGRSQVIMTDVADVIEWMMPAMLEFLTAPDKVCKFKPVHTVNADVMDDAAALVHHILFDENNGYKLVYDFIHDGLLLKTGVFKVTADDDPVTTKTVKKGLSDEEIDFFEQQPGVEISEDEIDGDERTTTFLVEMRKGKVDIEVLRPESFAVSSLAESEDDKSLMFHVDEISRSDLIEMGMDEDEVYELPKWSGNGFTQQIRRERHQVDNSLLSEAVTTLDRAMEEILVFEIYMNVDYDGDGIAERRKILAAGPDLRVIDNIEIDEEHPFVTWCPFPVPHKFFGQSLADRLYDVQIVHSTLVRQGLDSVYNANINRVVADIDAIDPDDLLTNNLSGVVKMDLTGGAINKTVRDVLMPIANTPVNVSEMIEHIQNVRRDRSGVDPYSQDATTQALSGSASGTAINLLQTSGRKKQEMIARHIADAVAKLCRKILNLAIQHGITAQIEQEDGSIQMIDPSGWSMDMIATVEVGLGYGSRDRELAAATELFGMQMQLAQLQEGPSGPLLEPQHISNAVKRFVRASQLGSASEYVVTEDQEQQIPEHVLTQLREEVTQEIMQSMEMQKAQMDMQKLQAETEGKQLENQSKAELARWQVQLEQARLQNARMQPQLDQERNRINLEREIRTADIDEQKAELEAGIKISEYQTSQTNEAGKLDLERQKAGDDVEADLRDHEIDLEKLDIERQKVNVAKKAAENPAATTTTTKKGQ